MFLLLIFLLYNLVSLIFTDDRDKINYSGACCVVRYYFLTSYGLNFNHSPERIRDVVEH